MKNRLVALLFLLLASCSALGRAGLVAAVKTEGSGILRTDGSHAVAIGEMHGAASVFFKGSSPLVMPYDVSAGKVFLWDADGGPRTVDVGSPLPSWARDLFAPGELEQLGAWLGKPVEFEQ